MATKKKKTTTKKKTATKKNPLKPEPFDDRISAALFGQTGVPVERCEEAIRVMLKGVEGGKEAAKEVTQLRGKVGMLEIEVDKKKVQLKNEQQRVKELEEQEEFLSSRIDELEEQNMDVVPDEDGRPEPDILGRLEHLERLLEQRERRSLRNIIRLLLGLDT